MTISSEVRTAGPYPGNGIATTFPFGFKIFQSIDLLVVLTVDGAEQQLAFGDDYAVSLNPDQEVSPGGEVTLSVALPVTQLLTLTSDLQNLQPTQITNQGAFYPEVINQALDRVTILVQQVVEKVSRAVKVPISSSTSPDDLISSLNQSAADAIAAAADAQQTSAEISIKVEAAQSAQAGAEAAQAGAEAVLENAVQQTSDTGAALLPEGTDAQRPATGSIPAGALVMRGNTQDPADYKPEFWGRDASAWLALASRLWSSHVFVTRSEVINGCFQINQRVYASGAVTTSGQYTLDRWKVTGAAGITFSTVENKTTVTIPAGQTLQQVIEGLNLQSGRYVLSWEGSAKGRIGAGAYGDSGISAHLVGGTNATIEFNAGTLTNVRLEFGFASPGARQPNYDEERRRCLRYYRTSYVGVKAGTISSAGAAVGGPYYNNSSGASGVGCILAIFDTPMRATPTVGIYSPNTGAINSVYDITDRPATVNALSMRGFYVGYSGNGSFVGVVHYVADAELA